MSEDIEPLLSLLRAAQRAAWAYQAACNNAGFGYRVAQDDGRIIDELEEHAGNGGLTTSIEDAMGLLYREAVEVSPFDEDGYVYQGLYDEMSDEFLRLGLTRPDEDVCICDAIVHCPVHDGPEEG